MISEINQVQKKWYVLTEMWNWEVKTAELQSRMVISRIQRGLNYDEQLSWFSPVCHDEIVNTIKKRKKGLASAHSSRHSPWWD